MYSGHLMDELTQMVARAEEHAHELEPAPKAAPEPYVSFVSRYIYDGATEQVYAGVA